MWIKYSVEFNVYVQPNETSGLTYLAEMTAIDGDFVDVDTVSGRSDAAAATGAAAAAAAAGVGDSAPLIDVSGIINNGGVVVLLLLLGLIPFDNVPDDSDDPVVFVDPAPVIIVTGDNPASVELGYAYTDAGATATDNADGDLTSSIVTVE